MGFRNPWAVFRIPYSETRFSPSKRKIWPDSGIPYTSEFYHSGKLRSKRFRVVSERRGTGFSVLAEVFDTHPRYLLRNGTETLATQANTLMLQLVPDSYNTSPLCNTFFCFLADETGAADSSRRRYCGGITYNPSFKMCCGGTVQLKFGTRPRCCGTKAYDTSIQMCCGRTSVQYKLYRMSPRCCGTRAYDTSYQMCCDGISVQFRFGGTPRCCGTKGYDARSKKCCKNWLGNKWVCGMGDADQPFISKWNSFGVVNSDSRRKSHLH